MDLHRYDAMTHGFARSRTRRAALALLGSLIAAQYFPVGPAGAKGKKKKKVTVCRGGQTVQIAKKKLKKQLGAGATRGACPTGPTVTQVTRTFSNNGQIAIPGMKGFSGPANPYPATIEVSGFRNGKILDIDLTLKDFSHGDMDNVEILLVKDGVNALVLGDISKDLTIPKVTITLDDEAPVPLPRLEALTSGRFQPRNHVTADDFFFSAPAPLPGGATLLSTFDGMDPNGRWHLYVMDDVIAVDGSVTGGWELTITAETEG